MPSDTTLADAMGGAQVLMDAGQIGRSLEYDVVAAAAARASVPWLADLCVLDLLRPDGQLRREVSGDADPARDARLREIADCKVVPAAVKSSPSAAVIETGRAVMHAEFGTEREHRDEVPMATLCVALRVGARMMGAMTLCRLRRDGAYVREDLPVAERLAACIASALANAEAFEDAVGARRRLAASNEVLEHSYEALQRSHEALRRTATEQRETLESLAALVSAADLPPSDRVERLAEALAPYSRTGIPWRREPPLRAQFARELAAAL